MPCRAVPCRAVPCRAVLWRAAEHKKKKQHLVSRGLADRNDPEVAQKLRDLHPQAPVVPLGDGSQLPAQHPSGLDLTADEWETRAFEAVYSFAPGSAPGPNGLRPSQLKNCLKRAGSSASLKAGLGSFVSAAADGRLPLQLAEPLCAGNLIPINKKDGGIRPIAVGDTIRRVVGKVLLHLDAVKSQLESLQPRQVGVGVPYATELVGMGLRRIADFMHRVGSRKTSREE